MSFFRRFTHPKATLSLAVDKNQLSLGEGFKGSVTLKSLDDFDLLGITVSLNCVESVKKTRLEYNEPSPARQRLRERRYAYDFTDIDGRPRRRVGETGHYETEEYWDETYLFSEERAVRPSMHGIMASLWISRFSSGCRQQEEKPITALTTM